VLTTNNVISGQPNVLGPQSKPQDHGTLAVEPDCQVYVFGKTVDPVHQEADTGLRYRGSEAKRFDVEYVNNDKNRPARLARQCTNNGIYILTCLAWTMTELSISRAFSRSHYSDVRKPWLANHDVAWVYG
jgi:hypothetical protein